jgi:hypothetical protein
LMNYHEGHLMKDEKLLEAEMNDETMNNKD